MAFRVSIIRGYKACAGMRNLFAHQRALIFARFRNLIRLFSVMVLAGLSSACSLSMHLASMKAEPEFTATLGKGPSPLSERLDEEDWRRAQSALSLAVDPQGSGQPVNWDNPGSKRRGSFAPSGALVLVGSTVCRPFTATVQDPLDTKSPGDTRHEGRACRVGPGEWALQDVKPLGFAAKAEKPQGMPSASTPMLPQTGISLDEAM